MAGAADWKIDRLANVLHSSYVSKAGRVTHVSGLDRRSNPKHQPDIFVELRQNPANVLTPEQSRWTLANGHGRCMAVTPERTLLSVGEWQLHTAVEFLAVSLPKPPCNGRFTSETAAS